MPIMAAKVFVSVLAAAKFWPAAEAYVWPDPKTDVIESLLYQQVGFRSNGILALLGTGDGQTFHCRGLPFVRTGQSLGAEWVRNAYHDMATHDAVAGTGGMDASIVFEMDRPENVGSAFLETAGNVLVAASMRASGADLFAYAAVIALGVCSNGTVIVPLRAGRIDATEPGPYGVPQPQEDLESHTKNFAKQGFNMSEMIGLVACGHSVGGVHGVDFPEIVDIVNDTRRDDNTIGFDSTANFFDNRVATEFVANNSQNPLAFGHNETTRSDLRIFNADGGIMISKMAESQEFFLSTCTSLFERMLNTVPKDVTLSDVITTTPVKPVSLSLDVNANNTLTISGTIRFDKTVLPSNAQVLVHFSPRVDKDCSQTTCLVAVGTTNTNFESRCAYPNCGPPLKSYMFTADIPSDEGISSFIVEVIDTVTKTSVMYDNSGHKFPLSDSVIPSASRSCIHSTQTRNVTVLVLNAEQFDDVLLVVPERAQPDSLLPSWVPISIPMGQGSSIQGTNYTAFTANYTLPANTRGGSAHPFDVIATGPNGKVESLFNDFVSRTCSE